MEATTATTAGVTGTTTKRQQRGIKVLIGVLLVVVVLPVVFLILGLIATFALRSADSGAPVQTPAPVEAVAVADGQ